MCNGHGLSVSCVKWPLVSPELGSHHRRYEQLELVPSMLPSSGGQACVVRLRKPREVIKHLMHLSGYKPDIRGVAGLRPGQGRPTLGPKAHLKT